MAGSQAVLIFNLRKSGVYDMGEEELLKVLSYRVTVL
jgi:hypothetical protein